MHRTMQWIKNIAEYTYMIPRTRYFLITSCVILSSHIKLDGSLQIETFLSGFCSFPACNYCNLSNYFNVGGETQTFYLLLAYRKNLTGNQRGSWGRTINSPVIGHFMFTNNEIAHGDFLFKMCLHELFTVWCSLSGLVLPDCIWLAMVILPEHSVTFLKFAC